MSIFAQTIVDHLINRMVQIDEDTKPFIMSFDH